MYELCRARFHLGRLGQTDSLGAPSGSHQKTKYKNKNEKKAKNKKQQDYYDIFLIRELQAKFQLNPLKSKDFNFFQVTPENLVFYAKMEFF